MSDYMLIIYTSAYLVLGNYFLKLGQFRAASEAYCSARDTLNAEGRAGNQPATAMVIYKLGLTAYRESNYEVAA